MLTWYTVDMPEAPDFTIEADADHTYGMVFRFYAGNQKELTRWFATPEDGKLFAARNAIVELDFIRLENV